MSPAGIKQTAMASVDLYAGMRIVVEARDPVTGNEIAGVELRDITLYFDHEGSGGGQDTDLAVWLQAGGN